MVFFPRIAASAPSSASEIPIEWTAEPRPIVSLSPSRPRDVTLIIRLLGSWQRRVAEEHVVKPFDVAFALWALPGGWVARRLHRRLGLPYAVWALGSDINTYGRRFGFRGIVRGVLRDAGAVFANSNTLVDEIETLAGRHAEFLATSRPIQRPAQLAALPQGTNFLFVGRLEPVKGADVLVEAASMLAARSGGWHLTVVGDGSLAGKLGERVRQDPGLSGRITFTGHLDGERLLSYLYACDCVVIPSRSESLPVVFSEALQAGKRFIATDVGDLGELISRYELGEVVVPGDAEALARALERFLGATADREPPDRELLGLFDMSRSAGRFCEVADEIIRGARST